MGYPIQGADVGHTRTANDHGHTLGSVYAAQDGKEYVFVHANGAIGIGNSCIVDEAGEATELSATTGAADGVTVAVPQIAFADNEYGWMQVKGTGVVTVLVSCAANVPLYATATAGALDDTATANEVIGIRTTAAEGGVGTDNVACYMDHPTMVIGTFA